MIRTVNLSLKNINPFVNKEYRTIFYENKNTLNGVYSKRLPDDINLFLEYCEGRIVLEGDTDFEEYMLPSIQHTHESITSQDNIFRKNETDNFTRVLLRNLPPETVKRIDNVAWKVFGRAYGNASRVISMAMIFGLKMHRGVTCIAEESKSYVKHVIEDKVTSPMHSMLIDIEKMVDDRFNKLEKMIIESKNVTMAKKIISNPKHLKRNKRTLNVVNSLKRINKSSFTEDEYAETVDLQFGIGDLRTVCGDLQAAMRRKLVVMRHSKYYFVDNDLYDSVQGPDARRVFNEKMKAKLREFKEVTLEMFRGWVKDLTGLFDDKSVNSRLEGLITRGWLTPLGSNGNIFTVNLD